MVWLSWNPTVSTGVLCLVSLGVSYAEEKADGVAPVRGQGSDFVAVGNGTAIWSITWKTTDCKIQRSFFRNMNGGHWLNCLLSELSGSSMQVPPGRAVDQLESSHWWRLATTAGQACDSCPKLTHLSHNGRGHVMRGITPSHSWQIAYTRHSKPSRAHGAASPLLVLFLVTG